MKNFVKFLLATFLLMIPVSVFAQDVSVDPTFDILSLFTSFLGFSTGVVVITGLITKYVLKKLSSLGRSIASWLVATIIGFIGWGMQLGIFAGTEWYMVLVIVVSFASGSNVIYNVDWIRTLLGMLKILPEKTEK